jgi:hypothetical protein
MSRGLGTVQRRLLDVLNEGPANEGLPIHKLKALAGGERANLRRAIRTMARRRWVEEAEVEGERIVRLTRAGALKAMPPLPKEPDPRAELRARRKAEGQRRTALKEKRARQATARGLAPSRRARRPRRRLRLGQTQKLVLAVLAQGIDGEFRALETTYLKSLVAAQGGPSDRSNLRRAIRTLLELKYIEERIVNGWHYYELTLFGFISAVPLNPATAPRLFDLP